MASIRGTTENNGTATTLVLTPEVGTASGDALAVFLNDDATGRTLTAPDGTWTTIPGDNVVHSVIGFYKVLSAAPAANYTFSGFAGGGSNVNAGTMTTIALAGETVEAVAVSEADENVSGTTLATTAVTGVANPSVLLCAWGADDGVTVSVAPSGMTLESAVEPGATLALETYSQVNPGTGSLSKSLTWSGATQTVALAVLFDLAAAGPTIDTQPTAQTARLNGEADTTATFTVAATTSGGALSCDWELEDGVASGVYANVADGSGATWSGQAAASVVGTFSAVTLSGRRLRCNVTDSNGTTTTSAVALTILTGPVVTGGTTNGSGQLATNLTSDDALTTDGEVLLITDTDTATGTVVGRTTTRPG